VVTAVIDTEVTTPVPLVVDLDGTLTQSDLLVQSVFAMLAAAPLRGVALARALLRGKAALKHEVARHVAVDPQTLPLNEYVLAQIAKARGAGRPVLLVSASHDSYVEAVAKHLGLFDGWIGSTTGTNLRGVTKAERLVEQFGAGGFDYIGNDAADLAVWKRARTRIAINPPAHVRQQLLALDATAEVYEDDRAPLRALIKLIRVHQWAKNLLVFVPLLTARLFEPAAIGSALLAFVAFSMAASAIYIVNDLTDIEADRAHPEKRTRPLAAGTFPLSLAMALVPGLLVPALGLAFLIAPTFAGVLVAYIVVTLGYSFGLKRLLLVDVVVLAALYTVRVIGGAAAIEMPVSAWLLVFSMFFFFALALVKRQIELALRTESGLPDATNRGYRAGDLSIIASIASGSALSSLVVFALYITDETVQTTYARPELLWLIWPVMLFWISRVLVLAHRRVIDDDPVLFAVGDRVSWGALAVICVILFYAGVA
jgi:4-hydroxybenzoate polyprenyltransferase/phosphoserine phosphatase